MDWFIALTQIINRILGWIDAASKKKEQQDIQASADRIYDDPVAEFNARYGVRSKDSGNEAPSTEADTGKRNAE